MDFTHALLRVPVMKSLRASGFNLLPNELYNLIAEEIQGDIRTLIALTQVSKRCHTFFNSILYKDVGNSSLATLSFSEKYRLR